MQYNQSWFFWNYEFGLTFLKSINVILHINRIKKTVYMITLIDYIKIVKIKNLAN